MRTIAIPAGVALLLFLFGAGINSGDVGLYDRVLRWQASRQPADDSPYVMVEIDDRSIEALGRFPWSRSAFADLFDRTREGKARVVGVDVLFAEPADAAGDTAMARALTDAGNVVLASVAVLSRSAGRTAKGALGRLREAEEVIEPIPELADAAAGVASISIIEDSDGSMRRYTLMSRFRDAPYPSLAQIMAGIATPGEGDSVVVSGDGTMLINWGSLSPKAITRVSFVDVLGMKPDELLHLFENRIVMVAATYTGGVDVGPTPLDPRTPSSFAHIYGVNTLLTGKMLRRLPGAVPFVLAVLMVGLLSTQLTGRHALQLIALGIALVVVVFVGTLALFHWGGIVLDPALPIVATGMFVIGYGLEEWRVANRALKRRNKELLDTLENLRRTTSAKERMETELNIARDIQLSMLPVDFPRNKEFTLHATLVPAREVGGDFYDFFFIDEHHVYICVGDVSGKGVPAALFMSVAKALLKSGAGRGLSPSSIMSLTNHELAQNNDASMFVTVWLGILDLRSGRLRYTNAGHNPPYIRTRDEKLVRIDQRHGPVVAAVGDLTFREGETVLGRGDTIFLYTDGVPEAMSPAGELYGEERLTGVLKSSPTRPVDDLVGSVMDDIRHFQDSASQADDITILALYFDGYETVD